MLITALVLQASELAAMAGFWLHTKHVATRELLIHGKRQPTKLPFVDDKLKEYAGVPSNTVKSVANRLTKLARKAVNTKAFEHVVTGLCNGNSAMRKKLMRKSPVVVIL